MSSTILTDAVIAKESMAEFHNQISFTKNINKQYSGEFARTGAKIGNTINVKKANRYVVQQGPSIVPQGTSESSVPLTLNRYWTVPLIFSGVERAFSLDKFRKNYIVPAVTKLASQIDYECHYAAVNGQYPTANSAGSAACPGAGAVNFTIGTPGTVIGTPGGSATGLLQYNAPSCFLNAGLILDNNAAPRDGQRTFQMNAAGHAQSVGSLTGLFNPQGIISEQYKKGLLGNALDFDFTMDQNTSNFTSGTATTANLGNITITNNTAAVVASGTTGTLAAGTTFTVAGYYAVNPENQQNTGILAQFVAGVNSRTTDGSWDLSVSGDRTITVSPTPKLTAATVPDGNIWTSTGAVLGAVAGTITSGASGTATPYATNLAFHPDAFTLATADLELPQSAGGGGVKYAAREVFDGISMRIVTFWDGMSDSHITRLDVLGGFSVLRPEWAVRISN